jgi:hypothetical protein
MKKILAVFLMLCSAGALMFAQELPPPAPAGLALRGTGVFEFIPYISKDGDSATGDTESAYTAVQFIAAAENYGLFATLALSLDPNVGLQVMWPGGDSMPTNVLFPTGTPVYTSSLTFNNSIWVKPFKWLKFQGGYFADFTLAGKVFFSPFYLHPYVTDTLGPDHIFTSLGFNTDRPNISMSLTPVENLFVGVSMPVLHQLFIMNGGSPQPGDSATEDYKKIQTAAGYIIGDIGHLRAQYVGVNETIEAAFAFTMVKGLVVDIGAKIPVSEDVGKPSVKGNFGLGAGVSFAAGPLSLNTLIYFGSGYNDVDPNCMINPWITYAINNSWTVGADANVYIGEIDSNPVNPGPSYNGASFAVFVERALGFMTNCRLSVAYDTHAERFTIPLQLSVAF